MTSTRPVTGPHPAERLRGLCGGAVHLPGDVNYDIARMPWNVAVEHHPAAVAYPAFPDEVRDVLLAARDAGLTVAPQGTGHGAAPLEGKLGSSVLLRTSAMTELSIDPERRIARVGAGVLWGDAVLAAADHGLAALHASSPDVGVVGYTLGGGISWYARSAGLQSSLLIAAELVLADGTFVRVTADDDGDLFWGLQGGGGGLGVVTAIEFELLPLPTVFAGMLVWDWTEAERVLPTWIEWSREAPDEITTSLRILHAPDIDSVPPPLRNRGLVVIDGALRGSDERGAELLAPLRALAPEADTFTRVPASTLARLHLEPEGPTPGYARSALLGDLSGDAISALLDVVGPGSGSQLTIAELRQLGGAVGRPDPRGGVLDHLAGDFLALGIGVGPDPVRHRAHIEQAGRMLDALQPWTTGGHYLPMVDDVMEARTGFDETVFSRLTALRAELDPNGLFLPQHLCSADD